MSASELLGFLRRSNIKEDKIAHIFYRCAINDEVEFEPETAMSVYGEVMYEMGVNNNR